MGQDLKKFNSFLIISYFFDIKELVGAITQLDLGLYSKKGKTLQNKEGKTDKFNDIKNKKGKNIAFKETSAEIALTIYNNIKRNLIFINLL